MSIKKKTGKKLTMVKKWTLAGAASIFALQGGAYAQASEIEFDIDATNLGDALNDYGLQSGKEIIFVEAEIKDKTSNGIEGVYDADEALERILRGSGIDYRTNELGTVLVGTVATRRTSLAEGEQRGGIFRMAQVNQEETAREVDRDGEIRTEQDVVIVTGTNIRGVQTAAPSLTLDRQALELTGYSSIEDVFQRLPQNFTDINETSILSPNIGTPLSNANRARVEGVDLRGLGANSTLVLLDGKRRAGSIGGRVVDISILPLSLIDRVEIVFGGRSAVYGSDAVGGVVNFVTRDKFEGAETSAFFGTTENGGERFQASQLFGVNSGRGNFVAAYDYREDWEYDLVDVGLAETIEEFGLFTTTPITLQAQSPSRRHAAYASGSIAVTDDLEFYANTLYSDREINSLFSVFNSTGTGPSTEDEKLSSSQLSIASGLKISLLGDWIVDISGSYSQVRDDRQSDRISDSFGFVSMTLTESDQDSEILSFSAVADGPLFTLGGVTPKLAFGIESRSEEFEEVGFRNMVETTPFDRQTRSIQSVFAEIYIPLLEGDRQLDVSAAARFDRYSDFGDTVNPHVGVIFSPFDSLTFKGAYSTAFRAPDLINLGGNTSIQVFPLGDPSAAAGFSNVLLWSGDASPLQPEEAETFTIGGSFAPKFADWLTLSASYYLVNYDNRIDRPFPTFTDVNNALSNSDIFVDQINRMPTSEEVNAIVDAAVIPGFFNATGIPWDPATQDLLDVIPDLVVLDLRTSNVASERIRGLDFSIDANFETDIGQLFVGAQGTYVLKHERRITEAAPIISRLNDIGKPVDLKLQGTARWSRNGHSIGAIINYTDSYQNTLVTPTGSVDSFTTVDLSSAVNFGELADSPVLGGMRLTFNINNVFDKKPPRFEGNSNPTVFDQINASPFGRLYSVRLVKQW